MTKSHEVDVNTPYHKARFRWRPQLAASINISFLTMPADQTLAVHVFHCTMCFHRLPPHASFNGLATRVDCGQHNGLQEGRHYACSICRPGAGLCPRKGSAWAIVVTCDIVTLDTDQLASVQGDPILRKYCFDVVCNLKDTKTPGCAFKTSVITKRTCMVMKTDLWVLRTPRAGVWINVCVDNRFFMWVNESGKTILTSVSILFMPRWSPVISVHYISILFENMMLNTATGLSSCIR